MQCPHCFREVNTNGACPYCGFDPTSTAGKYPLALRPGSVLNGRYILGHVLGQGGFGITYIALDYQTKERVAIKEYLPTDFAGRSTGSPHVLIYSGERAESFAYGKAQFLEEAKTLAAFIGDAGIVRIYSYFEENGTAYFCMEYVDGLPLDKYMAARGGRLSPEEADRLLLPLMESLETVHAKGIVHRDIAPDNILVTPQGTAKLIDFGAARYSTGEKSKSLDVILKHGFAPVEQYSRRGRQGPWTDVYALAATYYYAVTGKVPPESVDRLQEDELIKPSALGVKISPEQEDVLLKALDISASGRFQSMEDFRRAMYEASPAAKAEAERRERALREELARLERERLAREQAEREAREKAAREEQERKEQAAREEAERRRREEEARKAREKAEREEAERKKREAKAEAERLKREEKERRAKEKAALREKEKQEKAAVQQTGAAGKGGTKKPKLPLILGAAAVLAAVLFFAFGSKGQPEAPALTAEPVQTAAETTEPTIASTPEATAEHVFYMENSLYFDVFEDHAELREADRTLSSISIPSEVEGKPVTVIREKAFHSFRDLTDITIPDSVTSIGEYAFCRCSSLKNITIPDNVTDIGSYAFYDCWALTDINIPDGMTIIEEYAFSGCSSLTSITIPGSVTSIGSFAFSKCRLNSITIPASVPGIEDNAFFECSIKNVYYGGNEAQWNAMEKGKGNEVLSSATIHFNSPAK